MKNLKLIPAAALLVLGALSLGSAHAEAKARAIPGGQPVVRARTMPGNETKPQAPRRARHAKHRRTRRAAHVS